MKAKKQGKIEGEELAELRKSLSLDTGQKTISEYLTELGADGVQLEEEGAAEEKAPAAELAAERGKKYDVGEMTAHSGLGAIFRARDLNIRRNVAMKVMLDQGVRSDKAATMQFIEEAQVTAQLEHPNVIPVHELGVDARGNIFYTMKLVRGAPLDQILRELRQGRQKTVRKYPLARLLGIFLKACDAVAFAHANGVIHRDLKPGNIMIGDFGEVLVLEWGLARILDLDEKASTTAAGQPGRLSREIIAFRPKDARLRTAAGAVAGTAGYMAPEQAFGKLEEIGVQADIYSLGAILYHILCLHAPAEGSTVKEALNKAARGEIGPPTQYNLKGRRPTGRELLNREATFLHHCPDYCVPDALAAVAMKALAVNKAERYQTVQELQKELETYQHGFATGAEEASSLKLFWLLTKRNKAQVISFAAALVLVVTVIVGLSLRLGAQVREAEMSAAYARESREKLEEEERKRSEVARNSFPEAMRRARAAMKETDWQVARKELDRALLLNEKLPEPWCMKGLLALGKHRFANAARYFSKVQELDPDGLGPETQAYLVLAQEYEALASQQVLSKEQEAELATSFKNLPALAGHRPIRQE